MLSLKIFFFIAFLKLCSAGSFKALLEAEAEEFPPHNGSARSGCPEWDELPRVWNSKFIAARKYKGSGHDIPALSCNGDYYEPLNGYQANADPGQGYGIGSLFVPAGCTFYGFCDHNFQGEYK